MTSILDLLDIVGPALSARLVPPAALRRVRAAASALPAGSCVCFFERRLLEPNAPVDFGLCYPAPAHRALLEGSELLARRVPFLWVESDAAKAAERRRPGVLLCLDDGLGRRAFGRSVPSLSEKQLLAIADAAHRLFLRQAAPRSVRDDLRNCFAALPAGGRVLHLSVMPSRSPAVAKLNLSLPKRALGAYLRKVGWPGSFSSLDAVWRHIAPCVATAKIDLTFSPNVRPKLGLEVVPSNASLAARRRVLAWLRRERLADAQRSADVAAWHGSLTLPLPKPTPVELDFGMKLVLDDRARLDAKAYFHIASTALDPPLARPRARRESHGRTQA